MKGKYKPLINDAASQEELLKIRKQLELQEKMSKEKREKVDNYSKYVKEMYWPKVSVKKQLEMEHIIKTLKN